MQARELSAGPGVVIGTPGRLIDFISSGLIELTKIRTVVLDEADRMLDMGFEPDIRKIIEDFGMPSVADRQTLMFSATFPVEIQRLASSFLKKDHLFITVGKVGSTAEYVKQNFVKIENEADRFEALLKILEEKKDQKYTLIFATTKRDVERLHTELGRSGFRIVSLHGDRTQGERTEALRAFSSGHCPIMISTNVASRGLDLKVDHVINYEMPNEIEDYVHRVGRTGRAGRFGLATSILSDADLGLIDNLMVILVEAKQDVPDWLVDFSNQPKRPQGGRPGGKFGGGGFGGRPHGGSGRSSGGFERRASGRASDGPRRW